MSPPVARQALLPPSSQPLSLASDEALSAWPALTALGWTALAWEQPENRPEDASLAAVQAANAWVRVIRMVFTLLHHPALAPPANAEWVLQLAPEGRWAPYTQELPPPSPSLYRPVLVPFGPSPELAALVSHALTRLDVAGCDLGSYFGKHPPSLPSRDTPAQSVSAWWKKQEASAGALAPLIAALNAEVLTTAFAPAALAPLSRPRL